jgi:hypothetical protein
MTPLSNYGLLDLVQVETPRNQRISCPGQPGFDVSNNFMDYSDCASNFTVGQVERMYDTFNSLRKRVEPCHDDETDIYLEVLVSSSDIDLIDVGYSGMGKKKMAIGSA